MDTGNDTLATFSWGSEPFLTGGKYKMCWCGGGFECQRAIDFKVEVGYMHVVGWAQNLRTCYINEPCVVRTLVGYPIELGDRLIVMDLAAPLHHQSRKGSRKRSGGCWSSFIS